MTGVACWSGFRIVHVVVTEIRRAIAAESLPPTSSARTDATRYLTRKWWDAMDPQWLADAHRLLRARDVAVDDLLRCIEDAVNDYDTRKHEP